MPLPSSARVFYALATEIYGLPTCYAALLESIQEYRSCASYAVSDKTDAAFNLAQALQTLGEYVTESVPSTSILRDYQPEAIWREARQILEEVRQDQVSRLERNNPIVMPGPESMSDAGEAEEVGETSAPDAAVTEEQVLTASTAVETIIAAMQADFSLAQVTNELPQQDLLFLLNSASSLNAIDGYMTAEIATARHELVKTKIRLQLETGETVFLPDLKAVIDEQTESLSQVRRPDPAGLSDLADSLVLLAEVTLEDTSTEGQSATQLQRALELYQQARGILSNTFQRPSSTPAHHISSLMSANWQATAFAAGILALSTTNHGYQSQDMLVSARSAALEALNATEGAFRAQQPDANGVVRFAKALRSTVREDYRTVAATRDSVLLIVRIFLLDRLIGATKEPLGEQERGLRALLKATWPDANDLTHALGEYVSDFATDGIGRLCHKRGLSEKETWSVFLQAP